MGSAITKNTICLVGSFPNYPHGITDDIQGIAKLALKHKIPLHVDCCLGSFVLPFAADCKVKLAPFNFSVNGVTSISVDHHKHGMAPKGVSCILYKENSYRHY